MWLGLSPLFLNLAADLQRENAILLSSTRKIHPRCHANAGRFRRRRSNFGSESEYASGLRAGQMGDNFFAEGVDVSPSSGAGKKARASCLFHDEAVIDLEI